MNKKYQVFISSTYEDLKLERAEVASTILELDCIPSGMEMFCAESDEQFNIIKRIIDLCDYYILIIANRYGSINKKENKSYTELEYKYACSKDIPVLVFIYNGSDKPNDKKIDRLDAFKSEVSTNRMVSYWNNKDDLSKKVAVALSNAFKKNDRLGWIKSDENDIEINRLKEIEINYKNLEKELDESKVKLQKANDEIESLTTFDVKLLYDQRPIRFKFCGRSGNEVVRSITIKEIFKNISIHFINIVKTEDSVLDLIAETIDKYNHDYISKTDLKKVCMQLIALGLFYTEWRQERKALFYGLTKKGVKERNELNLFTID